MENKVIKKKEILIELYMIMILFYKNFFFFLKRIRKNDYPNN